MQTTFSYHPNSSFAPVVEKADHYAQTDWPVFLMGESGVGKEVLAERIHRRSTRNGGPFFAVNCGAIAENLFESEMFGHEKGAFTGAVVASPGIIRQSHNGTLFLDEVGEMPLAIQAKLLRFLENQEIRSVGSTRPSHVNVRVLSATNRDLYQEVQLGRFRWDLLQRLSVLQLPIPPLRERNKDVAVLAHTFSQQFNRPIEAQAVSLLQSYSWPGNVRQLRNVLIRASVLTEGPLTASAIEEVLRMERNLTSPLEGGEHASFYESTLEDAERKIILERLRQCGGNKKETARRLGIAKSTLHEKLRRWSDAPVSHGGARAWEGTNAMGL